VKFGLVAAGWRSSRAFVPHVNYTPAKLFTGPFKAGRNYYCCEQPTPFRAPCIDFKSEFVLYDKYICTNNCVFILLFAGEESDTLKRGNSSLS
jgi:hypothetical protein